MIASYRRYLLSASRSAGLEGLRGASAALLASHEAQPGTALPSTFPAYGKLVAAHYTCREDVAGADVDELIVCAGLTRPEALAVLQAI
jgi:hypothetical protein